MADKNIQTETEEELRERLFAKESFVGNVNLLNSDNETSMRISKIMLERLLESPYTNYKQLQQYSRLLFTKKGVYFGMIELLSALFCYDYTLIPLVSPNEINKTSKKTKIQKSYANACLYTQKMDIKANAVRFTKDFLLDGECYYYKIENSTGIIYQKIPSKYCKPFEQEDGVWRYVVDCGLLTSVNDITVYPLEIQKAVMMYGDNELRKNLLGERYYVVKNGICFVGVEEFKHSFPPFAFLFQDLFELDEKKNLKDMIDKINNVKMIHSEVPTDSDGKPNVDIGTAKKYNEAIKNGLKATGLDKLVISITNPFKSDLLNLKADATNTSDNMLKSALTQVYNNIGINQDLFNCSSSSSSAMEKSIVTITSYIINSMFYKIVGYVNYELKHQPTDVKMLAKFYQTTIYNQKDIRKIAKDNMLVGGSKMEFLNIGYTPLEAHNLLVMENMLGVDKLFIPLNTSYTMSSKDGSDAGRPNSEEMKENGQEISDTIEVQKDKNIGDK